MLKFSVQILFLQSHILLGGLKVAHAPWARGFTQGLAHYPPHLWLDLPSEEQSKRTSWP